MRKPGRGRKRTTSAPDASVHDFAEVARARRFGIFARQRKPLSDVDVLLGAAITARRAELSMSAAQLASEIGVSQARLLELEQGAARISAAILVAVCVALATSVSALLVEPG